ncbi:MAG: NADH-quinone oxidoreductase subunit E [Salibaculum sp.]|uniref:NADH-quinone oxidoreductase subunit E n=1 Tax=Salibaculum sp. TaxID=2855480 RepID=UPI00286FCB7B|nr:NADH-quinone oxidoreductase subunit E [Salibaculum sp.]MDR9426934.1 NADH-quinone oxidoreductase subunit E [Salibaculum sp.]MDR9483156.1 NADH-quinone oxidoreductase subunit E [Salibaculum sp.]
MLRRPHHEQPDSFAFTPANQDWAEAQITKYPEGRQASAIIPLLWRAQEQEGWLSRPAIEYVAEMLDMAHIRALEVASFYFMFQLKPVGSVANIQICGTTSCMICGAEDLVGVCRDKIADKSHTLSEDGRFSWEEVECLGACANAPMAQIGKDYYEDLTAERLSEILDALAAGKVPTPGPQTGRFASEPLKGLTSLTDFESGAYGHNASVDLALAQEDTIKRIDGTEVPLFTPWLNDGGVDRAASDTKAELTTGPADRTGVTKQEARAATPAKPDSKSVPAGQQADAVAESAPETLDAPRGGSADDLKKITGVGPKLEATLNDLGFWHYDQIAAWGPAEIAWVDARLRFKGRIERDDWVTQARRLAKK